MDIFRQADAVPVGGALMILLLPIGDAAGPIVLREDDLGKIAVLAAQA